MLEKHNNCRRHRLSSSFVIVIYIVIIVIINITLYSFIIILITNDSSLSSPIAHIHVNQHAVIKF